MTAKEYFIEHLSGEPLHQDVVIEAMIEFAKYHVEQALKAASEKSILRIIPKNDITYFREEILVKDIENLEEQMWIKVEDTSILNAYPLENIK